MLIKYNFTQIRALIPGKQKADCHLKIKTKKTANTREVKQSLIISNVPNHNKVCSKPYVELAFVVIAGQIESVRIFRFFFLSDDFLKKQKIQFKDGGVHLPIGLKGSWVKKAGVKIPYTSYKTFGNFQ